MKKGKCIVIVAPSGTGKSTLVKKIKARYPNLVESVSYTTRNIRDGEKKGISYNFVSVKEFQKLVEQKAFLEWAEVHGNYYGTNKNLVQEELSQGKNILLELDVQGADALKRQLKNDVYVIFIEPPSIDTLHKRLRSRGTEDTITIDLRISNAENELKRKNDYDFLVTNDEIERACSEMYAIIDRILGE